MIISSLNSNSPSGDYYFFKNFYFIKIFKYKFKIIVHDRLDNREYKIYG